MISLGTVWASTLFAVSGIITTIVENIIFLFVSLIFNYLMIVIYIYII